jgi:hypothetical protein
VLLGGIFLWVTVPHGIHSGYIRKQQKYILGKIWHELQNYQVTSEKNVDKTCYHWYKPIFQAMPKLIPVSMVCHPSPKLMYMFQWFNDWNAEEYPVNLSTLHPISSLLTPFLQHKLSLLTTICFPNIISLLIKTFSLILLSLLMASSYSHHTKERIWKMCILQQCGLLEWIYL